MRRLGKMFRETVKTLNTLLHWNLCYRIILFLIWTSVAQSRNSFKCSKNTNREVHDLCIVGAGFFGSAAARHASEHKNLKICLIGLDEPSSKREYMERDIFSSNYDSGRVVKQLFQSPATQKLVQASIRQFRLLATMSDVDFYHPVGFLKMGDKASHSMRSEEDAAAAAHTPVRTICDQKSMDEIFPFLKFQHDYEYALHDYAGTGVINPRKLLEAEMKVARQQGCRIIIDKVENVKPLKNNVHIIETSNHGKINCRRVLFTTGAFTNVNKFDALPQLEMTVHKEYAAMVRLPDDEAERLRFMPSMEYENGDFGRYIVAPTIYPDGRCYIKLGNLTFGLDLENKDEIKDVFVGKASDELARNYSQFLFDLIPGFKTDQIKPKLCVLSTSPTEFPYIDQWTKTITVAVVGNGWGATQCEEVGRLAAHLSLFGVWDSEVPKSLFEIVTKDRQKRCKKCTMEEC